MQTPVLETPRLMLRPIALSDAPAVQKHFNNWKIISQLSTVVPWPYPNDGAIEFIQSQLPLIAAGEKHIWVLVPKIGADEAIGLLEFRISNSQKGSRGFWLSEDFWGQGLMTEAVTALNDFVFNTLKLEKYEVCNSEKNTASRRVKEKTGARLIAHRDIPHHSGHNHSEVWEVTRDLWLATQEH